MPTVRETRLMNSKKRVALALAVNPAATAVMAWRTLGPLAASRAYWREEERRARLGRVGA